MLNLAWESRGFVYDPLLDLILMVHLEVIQNITTMLKQVKWANPHMQATISKIQTIGIKKPSVTPSQVKSPMNVITSTPQNHNGWDTKSPPEIPPKSCQQIFLTMTLCGMP
jgi:hypothetical protein